MEPMQDEDVDLARRAVEAWKHYEKAFDTLCVHYRERLIGYCRRLLNSQEDGEDATQNAFQRALRSFATLDKPEAFRGWLYQIAKNCCMDILDKRRKSPILLQSEFEPLADIPNPEDAIRDLQDDAASREAVRAANQAIAARDELDQAIYKLMYVEGVDNVAEISRRLERPENTIWSRLKNIRAMVAEIGLRLKNSA